MWEWKTYRQEGTTWVGLIEYDTKEQAQAELSSFGPNSIVVEINKPDQ